MRLFTKWLICCGSIYLAWVLFPGGMLLTGPWTVFLAVGTVLWLINLLLRPVVQVLALPLTLATLGLFSLVVNAAMVALADALLPTLHIRSFWLCVFIALVISAGNLLFARRR